MALDSKQKRGSVLGLSLPFRSWLAEPDATLANTDRLSLLRYGAAIAPASPGGFQVAWAAHCNVVLQPGR